MAFSAVLLYRKPITSARPPYWVRLVHSRSLSKAEDIEFLMREIPEAYFFLNCRAPETVVDLVKMSLGSLRRLLGQKRALPERHAVLKPEVSGGIKMASEDEEAVLYESSRPVKPSRRE